MIFMPEHAHWGQTQAFSARQRMQERNARLIRQKNEQTERLEAKAIHKLDEIQQTPSPDTEQNKKQAIIEAALARARARRAAQPPTS